MEENACQNGQQKQSQRDAGMILPEMVMRFLILRRCGLSDDKRAVVLGRTGGTQDVLVIGPALRSCFLSTVFEN